MLKQIMNDKQTQQKRINQTKPQLYVKTDKELLKTRITNFYKEKTESNLKRLYFNRLKFYFKSNKLQNRINLRQKKILFNLLKKAYKVLYKKHKQIIDYFSKIRRLKYITYLFKSLVQEQNINKYYSLVRLIHMDRFFRIVKFATFIKQKFFKSNLIFYFRLVSNKFKRYKKKKKNFGKVIKAFKDDRINKLKHYFILSVLRQYCIKVNEKQAFQFFSRVLFFYKIRKILFNGGRIKNLLREFFNRKVFRMFKQAVLENELKNNEEVLIRKYYTDKIYFYLIKEVKRGFLILNKFRKLIKNYFRCLRIKKLSHNFKIIRINKQKTQALKFIYKNYKQIRNKNQQKKFFILIKKQISQNAIFNLSNSYYKENLCKKLLIILKKNYIKQKFLRNFISQFKGIYKMGLKRDLLDFLKAKTGLIISIDKKLTEICKMVFKTQFNTNLHMLRLFNIKLTINKLKFALKSKKANNKKLKLAVYFYKRKLWIKVFFSLNTYITYCKVGRMYSTYLRKTLVNKISSSSLCLSNLKKMLHRRLKVSFLNLYLFLIS
jgi:hypothetical protein